MYFVKVYVTYKDSVLDPQGEAVKGAVHRLGYDEIEDVRIGKYFEIKVAKSDRPVEEMIEEVCDKLWKPIDMKFQHRRKFNMKFAVIVFPGSNCDLDMYWAMKEIMGADCEYVRYDAASLDGFDGVLLPGGFSYGDYLRCGAIARFANIMDEVIRFAEEGKPVFGTCNGFQILTEAGLLPGALRRNDSLKFISKITPLKVVNNQTKFTSEYKKDEEIQIPVAHGEGNYYCDEKTLAELKANNQIVFTYEGENINGSVESIAGITNKAGNVLGMMPHPERAMEKLLGSDDGKNFFASILTNFGKVTAN